MEHDVTLDDILAARERIRSGVLTTPCPESIPLSRLCDAHIYCKLEQLQRTGSFKERGARNRLLLLDQATRRRGVIAASAGNHALGLAYHGAELGIPVTVVMPRFAPLVKQTTCQRLGARVIQHGERFADAKQLAEQIAADEQLTYVHGFDDAEIIAGQGTLGLEILEQTPGVEAIVVPIGGAGLIAGVALAVKALRPEVQIIGVEPHHAASYTAALQAGGPTRIETSPTLADGLAIAQVGPRAFAIARDRVDRVVLVSEAQIALAILRLVELEKSVVEGAGAAPLAAMMSDSLTDLRGKQVVLLLAGGNIDPMVLSRLIESGLAADGRLCRFKATISDRPGGLAALANILAECGASVHDVVHERIFAGPDVTAVQVICTIETRDREHARAVAQQLSAGGIVTSDWQPGG